MNLNKAIKPKSLMETLAEAQENGFTMICSSQTGLTQDLSQFTAEILSSPTDYQEYARYGNLIIRLTEAWKEDSEIYELS